MREIGRLDKGKGQKGLFSIIVPVLNNAAQLQRCIDSISVQSEEKKELIVIDGGSIDGTLEVIARNRHSISQTVSGKDGGIYAAFNRGIRLSRGEWLLFLGSDDVLFGRDVLFNTARILEQKWSGQKIVYGCVAVLDSTGSILEISGRPWSSYAQQPIDRWSFDHQGVFHHRTFFEKHGLFDESFRVCGDHELLLRELMTSEAFFLGDMVVSGFTLGGVSYLPNNYKQVIEEKSRALVLNGLSKKFFISRTFVTKLSVCKAMVILFGADLIARLKKLLGPWLAR